MSARSPFRRGFKTEASTIARDARAEMTLSATAPLDPWALATHLEIPVIALSTLGDAAPGAVRTLTGRFSSQFSAVTVFRGPTRVILHNDRHALVRQRSNLCHELSHTLLFHEPIPAINHDGAREWDAALEAEANWLAGTLLVPDDAALLIVRNDTSVEEASATYGVSTQMMNFRIRVSGARIRVARTRALIAARA